MHYKNGREAKNGDKVVLIGYNGVAVSGILYDAIAGNDSCNGRIAITSQSDPCPNLAECLHADDIKAADIPDSTEPEATPAAASQAADAPASTDAPAGDGAGSSATDAAPALASS